MPRKGENIRKRKDGRWEARYEKCRDQNGRIQYVRTMKIQQPYVRGCRQDAGYSVFSLQTVMPLQQALFWTEPVRRLQ